MNHKDEEFFKRFGVEHIDASWVALLTLFASAFEWIDEQIFFIRWPLVIVTLPVRLVLMLIGLLIWTICGGDG